MNQYHPASNTRFLLMQIRNPQDPMRMQEVECFARALNCQKEQFSVVDLLSHAPTLNELKKHDVVLLGGSGDYSATDRRDWILPILECLQLLYQHNRPTFASCWGFQAMARALGGTVIHDLSRAELGPIRLTVTRCGQEDPVFGELGESFDSLAGHEDLVVELPADAILLASSSLVTNQAYTFTNKSIYCTQFHPELNRTNFLQRIRNYPQYVEKIYGKSLAEFEQACHDTPQSELILQRFVELL